MPPTPAPPPRPTRPSLQPVPAGHRGEDAADFPPPVKDREGAMLRLLCILADRGVYGPEFVVRGPSASA